MDVFRVARVGDRRVGREAVRAYPDSHGIQWAVEPRACASAARRRQRAARSRQAHARGAASAPVANACSGFRRPDE